MKPEKRSALIALGFDGLLRDAARTEFHSYRTSDVIAIIGSGMCVAVGIVLLYRRRHPRREPEREAGNSQAPKT
jgi:hypothetical protein